jgi:hypothetical protein
LMTNNIDTCGGFTQGLAKEPRHSHFKFPLLIIRP